MYRSPKVPVRTQRDASPAYESITGSKSVEVLLGCDRPHLDLVQLLAPRAAVVLVGHLELFESGEAKALAVVPSAVAGAVVVDDVSERLQAGPVHVVDAVHEDERERDEHEREPEEEVIEQRVVCMWVESAQIAVSGC